MAGLNEQDLAKEVLVIVYLVRHGEAKNPAEDPARGLTPRGVRQVEATAQAALDRNARPSTIFHSSKARAAQTAVVLAEYLKPPNKNEMADGLAPNDDPGEWAERLKDMNEEVMLVGHLPHLPGLAYLLLGTDGQTEQITFQTATIAALENTKNGWKLLWTITPDDDESL